MKKEQVKKGQTEKEQAEKEQVEKEQVKKGQTEKEQVEKEQVKKEQVKKGQTEKEQVEKEQVEKEQVKKEQAEKEQVKKEQAEKEQMRKEQVGKKQTGKEQMGKEPMGRNYVKEKIKVLVKLFLSTLYLSAFTFGGGYVIVTLMKKKFVDEYHWIDEKEMLDLIAIAQSSPGAIAVNGAIVVGYKLSGIPGVLTAVVATVIPPFVVLSVVSFFYEIFQSNYYVRMMLEGMQAGVGAVIAAVVYDMGVGILREKDKASIIIMALAFVAAYILKVNVIYIVIICGLIGVVRTLIMMKRKRA